MRTSVGHIVWLRIKAWVHSNIPLIIKKQTIIYPPTPLGVTVCESYLPPPLSAVENSPLPMNLLINCLSLSLAYESFDKLLEFECKVSATVHFVFYFICTDVALKLKQLFLRVDVKGEVNSLPKSFALALCFLKPYWQLSAICV